MVRAIEVASRLVNLAASGDEPDPLTPLRLQKLLYYAQGWHLAVFGVPLFGERVEAWLNGPVVPDVQSLFAPSHPVLLPDQLEPATLPTDVQVFVDSVWEWYRNLSATALSKQIREEEPWKSARARDGAASSERSGAEITVEDLRGHFGSLAQKGRLPGVDPAGAFRGAAQAARREGRAHESAVLGCCNSIC